MPEILYLGDTSLRGPACYLAGVMHSSGWRYTYCPSDQDVTADQVDGPWRACILSDYPASRLPRDLQERIVDRVKHGAGLLMIGGWESYHGLGGNWNDTPIGQILPVEMQRSDDRVNCDHLALVQSSGTEHSILRQLPWNTHPPLIGGYNRFRVRSEARQLLQVSRHRIRWEQDQPQLTSEGSDPLLVIDQFGQGRVAALATDVAPHWVGPWVDWGSSRDQAQGPGADAIEVGHLYAQFFRQLVEWVQMPLDH